jgi:hypothetical protein
MQPKHDYTSLSQMKPASVQVKLLAATKGKSDYTYTLQYSNTSGQLAFFMNPQLMIGDEELTPNFWSQNYFSLAKNESITVTVSCPITKLRGQQPTLVTSGWNTAKQEMKLSVK